MTGLNDNQNDYQKLGAIEGKPRAQRVRGTAAVGQKSGRWSGWVSKESLIAERAGQELAQPQTQSNLCFCLPRIVQGVRETLLRMLLPAM